MGSHGAGEVENQGCSAQVLPLYTTEGHAEHVISIHNRCSPVERPRLSNRYVPPLSVDRSTCPPHTPSCTEIANTLY
jgi:hypothetical protein